MQCPFDECTEEGTLHHILFHCQHQTVREARRVLQDTLHLQATQRQGQIGFLIRHWAARPP
jgi:hypothetical protein